MSNRLFTKFLNCTNKRYVLILLYTLLYLLITFTIFIKAQMATSKQQSEDQSSPVSITNGSEEMNKKRSDYLSWEDYFMAVAFLSAQRSKDPRTQVGACIVNDEKKIVGIGYNGMPNGCSDDELPWSKTSENSIENKYMYVCHAEMNAILNKNAASVKGCIIYVTLFPCNECAKLIIQSGIRKVIYMSDKYHEKITMVASRRLLDMAKIAYEQHDPKIRKLNIDFDSMNC